MGTVHAYLAWSQRYGNVFQGLDVNSDAFKQAWRDLAARDPEGFGEDQHDFIKTTHFDVQVKELAKQGVDLSARGPAVQDAIWSTSVQYGWMTPGVFVRSLDQSFGRHEDLFDITDEQIITAVQDYKAAHVEQHFRSSEQLWPSLRNRAHVEKAELVALARTGLPAPADISRVAGQADAVGFGAGARSDQIRDLQQTLDHLGYTSANGQRLAHDGHFGERTREALVAFQRSSGLDGDGVFGKATMAALDEAVRSRRRTGETVPWDVSFGRASADSLEPYAALRQNPMQGLANPAATTQGFTSQDTPRGMGQSMARYRTPDGGILSMQQQLNALDMRDMKGNRLAEDGICGNLTKTAVARFQAHQGLPVTGEPDGATRGAIESKAFLADLQQFQESRQQWEMPTAPQMANDGPTIQWRDKEGPTIQWRQPAVDPLESDRMPGPERSADVPRSGYDTPPTESRTPEPKPSLSDPRHPENPQHGLYTELGRRIPGASEDRLLQFTAACHTSRITADNLSICHLDEQNLTIGFLGNGPLSLPVTVDLKKAPPEPEQAIEQIAQYDHQQAQVRSEYLAQQQQMSRSGPSL